MSVEQKNRGTSKDTIHTIEDFLSSISREKRAEAFTEAGDQGGGTTHPVKDVDDHTEAASEGARSEENSSDVKEDQGEPGVDSTPVAKAAEGAGCTAAADHLQIGTNVQATGDDSENETEKAKAGKEDPGSAHPARTDNTELDGHKYAADEINRMPLHKLAELTAESGNDLLAAIAVDADNSHRDLRSTKTATVAATNSPRYEELTSQVGWDLAGLITGNFDKQAADQMVREALYEEIKLAAEDADNVHNFYRSYEATLRKRAMDDPAAVMGGAGGDPSMGGAPPPMGDPSMGGGLPPMGGGPPPMGDPSMGDPSMGGGPPPMDGEGGPEDGADIEQLMAIMEQLGVSPEELMAALEGAEGGAPAEGGPPDAGGAPVDALPPEGALPGGAAPAEPPMEVTAADKQAQTAAIRNYIKETVSRSRAKRV